MYCLDPLVVGSALPFGLAIWLFGFSKADILSAVRALVLGMSLRVMGTLKGLAQIRCLGLVSFVCLINASCKRVLSWAF